MLARPELFLFLGSQFNCFMASFWHYRQFCMHKLFQRLPAHLLYNYFILLCWLFEVGRICLKGVKYNRLPEPVKVSTQLYLSLLWYLDQRTENIITAQLGWAATNLMAQFSLFLVMLTVTLASALKIPCPIFVGLLLMWEEQRRQQKFCCRGRNA